MQYQATQDFATAQDKSDPLRMFRDRFHFQSLDTPELVYFTGQLFDMQCLTDAAHAAAGFDFAHAAGNVPVPLYNSVEDVFNFGKVKRK